jgi:hypothetical protein
MGSLVGEFNALVLVKVIVPVTAPVIVGAKMTLKETSSPDESVSGRERLLRPNPAPATVAFDSTSLPVPTLVKVMVWVLVVPVATLPKLILAGVVSKTGV